VAHEADANMSKCLALAQLALFQSATALGTDGSSPGTGTVTRSRWF